MRTADERHLTPDEIVDRVFPATTVRRPSPLTSGACAACQAKVARLREAWLLDRGRRRGRRRRPSPSPTGTPSEPSILARLEAATRAAAKARPPWRLRATSRRFRFRTAGGLPPPPGPCGGSLAAALVLVVGLTVSRLRAPRRPVPDLAAEDAGRGRADVGRRRR